MRATMRATRIELKRAWSAFCLDRNFWLVSALVLLLYLLVASLPLWLMFFLPFFLGYMVMLVCLHGPQRWLLVVLLLVPIIIH